MSKLAWTRGTPLVCRREQRFFAVSEKERESIYRIISHPCRIVRQGMNFRELIKNHPSIIGLTVGFFILLFIIITILTTKHP